MLPLRCPILASDSHIPSWVARYDIDDLSYTVYTQTVHLVKLHLDESSLSSSLKSGNPIKYLVTHGITWGGDAESEKGLGIPEGPEMQKNPLLRKLPSPTLSMWLETRIWTSTTTNTSHFNFDFTTSNLSSPMPDTLLLTPLWVALYDIDDTNTFSHQSYTHFHANRSPRVPVKHISTELGKSSLASSLRSENPTRYLVMLGITRDGDAERENVARVGGNECDGVEEDGRMGEDEDV
ncbi:hypothetical protein D9758_018968 [Tetrapyrgos nigripes]|uniref:Uncharacterized protein n=1 Tax=Tetrapyrgos nigripes TaxID=182062 RepID=A0A8H5EQ10_9AGAR|nr:hypothetical protein D9758_018968 [Tetrapyrgos nigripes]